MALPPDPRRPHRALHVVVVAVRDAELAAVAGVASRATWMESGSCVAIERWGTGWNHPQTARGISFTGGNTVVDDSDSPNRLGAIP